LIDSSMLDIQIFYFIGPFTPTASQEYPDIGGYREGSQWQIEGVDTGTGYTYTTGSLQGRTIFNGDFIIYGLLEWTIIQGVSEDTFYRLDGSSAIFAPFAAGGQQLKNIADGTEDQDAVSLKQVNDYSDLFYHRDGTNPLTNHFRGAGYQLKDIANGTEDTDGATKGQLDTGLAPKADITYVDTQDDLKVDRAGDTMTGDLTVQADILVNKGGTVKSKLDDFGLQVSSQDDSKEFEAIFDPVTMGFDFKFNADTSLTANSGKAPSTKYDPTEDNSLTRKDYVDAGVNSKEDSLGNPTESEQYLTSTQAGDRSWVTPRKTFLDLDDAPDDYTGKGGQLIGVNQAEDGLEFGDAGPNVTRHIFNGDDTTTEFVIPGGYLPGNIDVYLDRVRQIVGIDIDASNGTSIIFATAPVSGSTIEITAYVKDSFLVLPNATENTVGGIRVRVDGDSVYITSDGTAP